MATKEAYDAGQKLADTLFATVKRFTEPDLDDAGVSASMDAAFASLGAIKKLDRETRVACVWRLSELGTFPLVVAAMNPASVTYSLSATLLGVTLGDVDLLSHKIGKSLVRDGRFLAAVEAGVKPTEDTAQLAMLVVQMLNNLLNSASAPMIVTVCEYGLYVPMFLSALQQAARDMDTMDWRFAYIVSEILLSMSRVPECGKTLDSNRFGDTIVTILTTITEHDCTAVGKHLLQHRPLLHRLVCLCCFWLQRVRVVPKETLETLATAMAFVAKFFRVGEVPPSEGPLPLAAVAQAIVKFAGGDEEDVEQVCTVQSSRIKDWDEIEKSAQAKVRSDEFKAGYEGEAGISGSDGDGAAAGAGGGGGGGGGGGADGGGAASSESKPTTTTKKKNKVMEETLKVKAIGNGYFKKKEFSEASAKYKAALNCFLDEDGRITQEIMDDPHTDLPQLELEQAKILSNLAECALRANNFDEALEHASDAIDADPSWLKGYFRRAKAYEGLGDVASAVQDLDEILEAEPAHDAAATLREKLVGPPSEELD